MRLVPSLLLNRIGFLNSIDDRELSLQSLRVNMIENLAVLEDQFDIIDFSHNQIRKMENFPKMLRLSILYFTNNGMSKIDSALKLQIPNLRTLELSDNDFDTFLDVKPLSVFPKLEFLALSNNPVSRLPNYRYYMIHLLPSLKYLDYQKVTRTEKELSEALFRSAAGKDLLDSIDQMLQKRAEEREKPGKVMSFRDKMKAKQAAAQQKKAEAGDAMDTTGDAGANSGGVKQTTAKLVLTKEQKQQVRAAIADAKDQVEVDRIELQLQMGSFPFTYQEIVEEAAIEKTEAVVEKETVAEDVEPAKAEKEKEKPNKGRQRRGSDVSVASEKSAAEIEKETISSAGTGKKRGRARSTSNVSNATVESKSEEEVKGEVEPKKKRGRARATSTTSNADSQAEEVEEPKKRGRKARTASTTSNASEEPKQEPKRRGRAKKA